MQPEGGEQDRDRQEFLLLLLTLLPLHLVFPVLSGGPSGRLMMILFCSLLLIAGVWIMRGSRRKFLMTAILTLVSLELYWISLWPAASSLLILGEFSLLLVLLIITGKVSETFIRTSLPVTDLLIAAAALFLVTGTILGLGLFLVSCLGPGGPGPGDEAAFSSSLAAGVSLLTLNGMMTGTPGHSLPLGGVLSTVGMISGVILFSLVTGKIGSAFLKKEE